MKSSNGQRRLHHSFMAENVGRDGYIFNGQLGMLKKMSENLNG